MHDLLNSEIWLDARVYTRAEFCLMPAASPAADFKLWLLNARHVAKTDVLIVFLGKFWV